MYACMYNIGDVIDAFISIGIDINVKDNDCNTTLHWLFTWPTDDSVNIAKRLIQHGAEINMVLLTVLNWKEFRQKKILSTY